MGRTSRSPLGILFAALVLLAGCAGDRPDPPPPGNMAWGAIHLDHGHEQPSGAMAGHIADAMAAARHWHLEVAEDGTLRYPVLSLSGGGSYVAFAAGVLAGWTETGNRPEFRVVTAMSGGALVAPWAFLGPDYDPVLEAIFTTVDTTDIYRAGPLGLLNVVFSDGAFDFSPGRDLIARYMTEEVVDAIADAHREGRRLYIATANMDDNVTTLWDIGAIAASDEADRVVHIRRIIEAAVAVPGLFPPVYFDIDVDGQRYGQMHTDAQIDFVLLRDFMIAGPAGLVDIVESGDARLRIYAIMSTKPTPHYDNPPPGSALILARRAIERIGRYASYGALDRLYLYALAHDAELRVAYIPVDYDLPMANSSFDREGLAEMFAYGYARAAAGYPWADRPPELPDEEVVRQESALP